MNKIRYESIYILKPTLTKEEINKTIEKLSVLIDEKGKVIKIENVGIKKLAYLVKSFTQGYYLIMDFEVSTDKYAKGIYEIEQKVRTFEEILKFLIVRKED